MRHTISITVAWVLLVSSAQASMMLVTRDWSVDAAGGHYGFIETEFVTLSGQHVGCETSVALGPLHFELPCRAPVAIILCVIASCILVWAAVVAVSRIRKHGFNNANAA